MNHTKQNELIAAMRAGATAVTVNTRLSRYIRDLYDREMAKCGYASWKSPVTIPLPAWISSLWNEGWPDRPVLSGARAASLWERVVSGGDMSLSRGIAGTAYDAYSMIKEYRISLPDGIYLTEEAYSLKRWIVAYEEEVERLGFVEQSSLADMVIRLIADKRIRVPEITVFAGFDEMTPRTASLIKAIEGGGGQVTYWPWHPEDRVEKSLINDRLTVIPCADEVEEVVQAARWVRRTIRPGIRIGVIVPELDRYRRVIKREFAAELNPESVFPWRETAELFNISLGEPLSEEPVVRSALDILSMGKDRQGVDRIGSLLLSPFFADSDEEYLYLARLDAGIRKGNRFEVRMSDIIGEIDRRGISRLEDVKRRLNLILSSLKESKANQLPGQWASGFSVLLKGLGWPSGRFTLNSREYQALKAWNGLLGDLASLDDVLGRISRSDAVSHITRLATDRIYQPESPESPIQVMGVLEASGIFFDHVYILGAHSDAFPAQPSPNPFIPLSVQKGHNLPHSSPERELAFSKGLLNRVLNSARSFVVSYPKVVDNKEVSLSPLFGPLENPPSSPFFKGGDFIKDGEGGLITESGRLKNAVHSRAAMEDMPSDEYIPPAPEELEAVSGGTAIIKDQSACPFRAFAIHRLHASGIHTPVLGLSAPKRGSIVHAALKALWDTAGDSKRLREMMEGNELDRLVKESVARALRERHQVEPLSGRYIDLERERLESLIREWIEKVESVRGEFTVKEKEQRADIDIEGLCIKARFDRIDTLGDGGEAIIDYKTGDCSRYDLMTDRPKEPQLLVYSLSGRFDAVAFARIRPGECGFAGVSRDEEMLPGVLPFEKDRKAREAMQGIENWDELTERWRATVRNLARQFLDGYAAVDPAEKACEYCDLMGLCRIFEAERETYGEEDE